MIVGYRAATKLQHFQDTTLSLKGFKRYPSIKSFSKVMSDAMDLAEKEEIIIPYICPICSNPGIISFPVPRYSSWVTG